MTAVAVTAVAQVVTPTNNQKKYNIVVVLCVGVAVASDRACRGVNRQWCPEGGEGGEAN